MNTATSNLNKSTSRNISTSLSWEINSKFKRTLEYLRSNLKLLRSTHSTQHLCAPGISISSTTRVRSTTDICSSSARPALQTWLIRQNTQRKMYLSIRSHRPICSKSFMQMLRPGSMILSGQKQPQHGPFSLVMTRMRIRRPPPHQDLQLHRLSTWFVEWDKLSMEGEEWNQQYALTTQEATFRSSFQVQNA